MSVFWKIWRALFPCNTHFEICPFALPLALYRFYLNTVVLTIQQLFDFFYLHKPQNIFGLQCHTEVFQAWWQAFIDFVHAETFLLGVFEQKLIWGHDVIMVEEKTFHQKIQIRIWNLWPVPEEKQNCHRIINYNLWLNF